MYKDLLQASIPLVAVGGAIALGLYNPSNVNVATNVLSAAVGGYYGYSQARKEDS